MISESVSELINHTFFKHLAASVPAGWAHGCRPVAFWLPLPSLQFKDGPVRSALEGIQASQSRRA